MKKNHKNNQLKRKSVILLEQSGYNPGTDDTFNPCTMAQFDLNCVYAGRKLAGSGWFAYPGGSTAPEMPPVTSASVACGAAGYSPVSNPPEPCLYYDVGLSKYMIFDTNMAGTNDCSTPGGCSWGDTVTFGNGNTSQIKFIGYECVSSLCTEDNSGSATYDTEANCISSGCGGTAGMIGCNDVWSYDYDSTFGGCDSNNTGLPNGGNAGPPWDTTCCNYVAGCLDDRVDSQGTYLALNTNWPSNVGPPGILNNSNLVVADNNTIIQLDNLALSNWGFPSNQLQANAFGPGAPYGCTYPPNNTISTANGCMDDIANNYGANYTADCAPVPILFDPTTGSNDDPYYPSATMDTSCCSYDLGCTDQNACNYDPNATVDDGNCETTSCAGCMDPIATDYNNINYISVPGVDLQLDCNGNPVTSNTGGSPFGNDQCCNYQTGCMDDVGSTNANPNAVADCQGNMIITGLDYVNNNSLTTPYFNWPSFGTTAGSTAIGPGATVMSDGSACCSAVVVPIEGCLDPDSQNYNPGADGCPTVDPAGASTDGYGDLSASNNSCCLYETYCQDPIATNYTPDTTGAFPCNDVDAGPPGFYYGETGFQPIFTGAVHLTNAFGTTPAADNDCCLFPEGCTDPLACNYDAAAINDDDSCTYIVGCMDATQDNYDQNATLTCYDNGTGITVPASNGICVNQTDPGYSYLGDPAVLSIIQTGTAAGTNSCCCIDGCTDNNAYNFDSLATCNDGSCLYYNYGCTDPTALAMSYCNTCDGCAAQNGALVPGTNAVALADNTNSIDGPDWCCTYTVPTWVYRCAGDYNPGTDDPSNPPVDGWGDCTEITNPTTDPIYNTLLNYQTNYGVQLLFESTISLADAASQCAAACTGCGSIPTAGCSSCAVGAQGQPCGTYTNDNDAIEDAFDPIFAGAFLFFDDYDDCEASPLCGLETYGCNDANYCEYYTQAIELNDGIGGTYVNMATVINSAGPGSYIGIIGPMMFANGCMNAINLGCPDPNSINYDPSATPDCPNPYYADWNAGGTIYPEWAAAPLPQSGPESWIDPFTGIPLVDIPMQYIDWNTNSYQQIIQGECQYSCEDETVNGLPVTGQPANVIGLGGSCWTCSASVTPGQQTMDPCIEVDNMTLFNSLNANSPYPLQWFNLDTTCDQATFCGGTLGCSDDGTGTMSIYDPGRNDAATNISPGWTTPGPEACNYDNDPTLAPDPSACVYTCVACLDDGDPNNASNIRPVGFIGPAFNYEYDCAGIYQANPLVDAVDANGDSCCCYVQGCTDQSAPNYDPAACFDDGSCDYNIYGCNNPTSSNFNSAVTVACDGNNGYPPNDYTAGGGVPCDPQDIGTSNCCCSDVGFDCVNNLCTPHSGSTVAEFLTLQACKDDGCGDGRYRCVPYTSGPIKTNIDDFAIAAAVSDNSSNITPYTLPDKPKELDDNEIIKEQKVLPSGDELLYDLDKVSDWELNTDPNKPAELDCCIPDPMGPHPTMQDCIDNSICGDCDDIKWKCKKNGSATTQSNDLCVQTVQADPDCLVGPCWDTQNQCIASGCEHNEETWKCPRKPPEEWDHDKNIMGEQSTGLSLAGSGPCLQSGYFGYLTKAACEAATECSSYTNPDPTCFIGSTLIKMDDGTEKRIDEIEIGEEVLNDEGTNSTVIQIQEHANTQVYGFNGEGAFVTQDHPLLVKTDGENEWKSIDPSWVAPFSHGVDTVTLEVGDVLIKGKDKKEMEITSIDKGEVVDMTYNLVLDKVHTYYANEYIAHNSFFRTNPINEDVVGAGGWNHWVNPTFGCPCPPNGTTLDPMCCKHWPPGPGPSPSGGPSCSDVCPNPNQFRCRIGYTWNPPGMNPPPVFPIPDPCHTGGDYTCIHCTEDPNRPGCCLEGACDPNSNQPCNGYPLIHQAVPSDPCVGVTCN